MADGFVDYCKFGATRASTGQISSVTSISPYRSPFDIRAEGTIVFLLVRKADDSTIWERGWFRLEANGELSVVRILENYLFSTSTDPDTEVTPLSFTGAIEAGGTASQRTLVGVLPNGTVSNGKAIAFTIIRENITQLQDDTNVQPGQVFFVETTDHRPDGGGAEIVGGPGGLFQYTEAGDAGAHNGLTVFSHATKAGKFRRVVQSAEGPHPITQLANGTAAPSLKGGRWFRLPDDGTTVTGFADLIDGVVYKLFASLNNPSPLTYGAGSLVLPGAQSQVLPAGSGPYDLVSVNGIPRVYGGLLPKKLVNAVPETEVTISNGAFTPTRAVHVLAAEAGSTDELDTVNTDNFEAGDQITVSAKAGQTFTVRHGTDNITTDTAADLILTGAKRLVFYVRESGVVASEGGASALDTPNAAGSESSTRPLSERALASTTAGQGVDMLGVPDPNGLFTGTRLGDVLEEIFANAGKLATAADYSAAQALSPSGSTIVYIRDHRRGGMFDILTGDYSAELAADPERAIYLPFASNPLGDQFIMKRRVNPGALYSFSWFGPAGDTRTVTSASITDGSTVLTGPAGTFSSAVAGQQIVVRSPTPSVEPHRTTVASVNGDGSQLTMAAPVSFGASTTPTSFVTGRRYLDGQITSGNNRFTTYRGFTGAEGVTVDGTPNAKTRLTGLTGHPYLSREQVVVHDSTVAAYNGTYAVPSGDDFDGDSIIIDVPFTATATGRVRRSTTVAFTADDNGRTVAIKGAGAGGVPLVTQATFVDSGTIDLSVNASTTVTNDEWTIGTEIAGGCIRQKLNAYINMGATIPNRDQIAVINGAGAGGAALFAGIERHVSNHMILLSENATVGRGVEVSFGTDDSVKLREAIELAVAHGRSLMVPELEQDRAHFLRSGHFFNFETAARDGFEIIGMGWDARFVCAMDGNSGGALFFDSAAHTKIRGLHIDSSGNGYGNNATQGAVVQFRYGSHVAVEDCWLRGGVSHGAQFVDCDHYSAIGNDFYDSANDPEHPTGANVGHAVYAANACTNGRILRNRMFNYGGGATVQVMTAGSVSDSHWIEGNHIQFVHSYGVLAYLVSLTSTLDNIFVKNNHVETVRGGPGSAVFPGEKTFGAGIYMQSCKYFEVIGNFVRDTCILTDRNQLTPAGIGSTGTLRGLVADNIVRDSNWWGCLHSRGGGPDEFEGSVEYRRNKVYNTTLDGFHIKDGDNVIINDNEVSGARAGIMSDTNNIERSHNFNIEGNTIRDVTDGIALDDVWQSTITRNKVYSPGRYGIYTRAVNATHLQENEITDNRVFFSTNDAYNLRDLWSSQVKGNYVRSGGNCGFRFAPEGAAYVTGIEFTNNEVINAGVVTSSGRHVLFDNVRDTSILDNLLKGTGLQGLGVSSYSGMYIRGNKVVGVGSTIANSRGLSISAEITTNPTLSICENNTFGNWGEACIRANAPILLRDNITFGEGAQYLASDPWAIGSTSLRADDVVYEDGVGNITLNARGKTFLQIRNIDPIVGGAADDSDIAAGWVIEKITPGIEGQTLTIRSTWTLSIAPGACVLRDGVQLNLKPSDTILLRFQGNQWVEDFRNVAAEAAANRPFVGFSAYTFSDQLDVTGDGTDEATDGYTIIFTQDDFDTDGLFNNGAGTFTADRDGYWRFKTQVELIGFTTDHTIAQIKLKCAGSTTKEQVVRRAVGSATEFGSIEVLSTELLVYLEENDTVVVEAYVGGGTKVIDVNKGDQGRTNFQGEFVGL